MFRLLFVATLVAVSVTGNYAQSKKLDSLRVTEGVWSLKKKAVVLQYMQLTEAEKSSFWPVYDSYHSATQYLEMEYIYLTTRFRKEHDVLNNRKIEELSAQILKNDLLLAKVRKQYFKKFSKALSPRQAGIFMQIDKTFRQMMRDRISNETPLAEVLQAQWYSRR